jgi:hypothetical protein
MKHLRSEPFGETSVLDERDGHRHRESLAWTGVIIFWLLVFIIVIARVHYFEPFGGFEHVTISDLHEHDARIETRKDWRSLKT